MDRLLANKLFLLCLFNGALTINGKVHIRMAALTMGIIRIYVTFVKINGYRDPKKQNQTKQN